MNDAELLQFLDDNGAGNSVAAKAIRFLAADNIIQNGKAVSSDDEFSVEFEVRSQSGEITIVSFDME